VLESFDESFRDIALNPHDYVVIITRGHLHDRTVLARALETGAGYIGMIGSRRKRDAIYAFFLKRGSARRMWTGSTLPSALPSGPNPPRRSPLASLRR